MSAPGSDDFHPNKEIQLSDDKETAQVIKADDRSTVAHIAQSRIDGDVVNSVVVVAGGDVVIQYRDRHEEPFNRSILRQQYLEAIIAKEKFHRWADERYIDETVRPLPMTVSPCDLDRSMVLSEPKKDLIHAVRADFEQGKRVLILGEPGAGKTTALERLVYLYAYSSLATGGNRLPLLVSLNRYEGDLYRGLQVAFNEVCNWQLEESQTKTLLSTIRALILFDGLNELGEHRSATIRAVRDFMDNHPHHLYALACRTQDYQNDIDLVRAWEIQPLDGKDIERYLRVHLGSDGIQLYGQIARDTRLAQLACNPLMLQMFKDTGSRGNLPQNRGDLYKRFVKQALWREKQKGDRAHSIPGLVKERCLARLGYDMQRNQALFYQESRVRDAFTSYLRDWEEAYHWRDLLEEIHLNGFLQQTENKWTFTHQSFQEFFAAYEIEERGLPDHVFDDMIRPEWNEVIFLLSGITNNSSKLITKLLAIDPIIAAKAIAQGVMPDQSVLRLVVDAVGNLSKSESWTTRRTCADLLGEICSPLVYPYLSELLKDKNDGVRWGAVAAIRMIRVPEGAIKALIPALYDPYPVASGQAAMTLGELGAVEAIPHLGNLLESESPYVRVSAVYALVRLSINPSIPSVERLLTSNRDRARILTDFAIKVVAHSDRINFVRDSLKNSSPLVREAALMLIVRTNDVQAAIEIEPLLSDTVSTVRAFAAQALGKVKARDYWQQVTALMLTDRDEYVRESAAAATEWMDVYEEACSDLIRAARDDSPRVRFAAVRSLGRFRTSAARPVLREVAANDPDEWVRLHAIRALGFIGHSDDLIFLQDLVTKGKGAEEVQSIYDAIENISRGDRKLEFW